MKLYVWVCATRCRPCLASLSSSSFSHHLRLCLTRFFTGRCVEDGALQGKSAEDLEKLLDELARPTNQRAARYADVCDAPPHIIRHWEQAKRARRKQQEYEANAGEREKRQAERKDAKEARKQWFDLNAAKNVSEEEREKCRKIWRTLQLSSYTVKMLQTAYGCVAHPPLPEDFDGILTLIFCRAALGFHIQGNAPNLTIRVNLLPAFQALGLKQGGKKKNQMVETLFVLFDEGKIPGDADLERIRKRIAITNAGQEAASRGKNAYEDGADQSWEDDIEKEVFFETQQVEPAARKGRIITKGRRAEHGPLQNEGLCCEKDLQLLEQQWAEELKKKTPREWSDDELKEYMSKFDPTQLLLPTLLPRLIDEFEKGLLKEPIVVHGPEGQGGAGKSHVARSIARSIGLRDGFLMSPTGQACVQMIEEMMLTCEALWPYYRKNMSDAEFDALARENINKRFLLVDEKSQIGNIKWSALNDFANKLFRRILQLRANIPVDQLAEDQIPDDQLFPGGFGHLHIILVGDFAQTDPIQDTSLLDGRQNIGRALSFKYLQANKGKKLWKVMTGELPGRTVIGCKLRRVYRNTNVDEKNARLKDVQRRLRDCALSFEDWEFLNLHSMERVREYERARVAWEEKPAAEREPWEEWEEEDWLKSCLGNDSWCVGAVKMHADNASCGEGNGKELYQSGKVGGTSFLHACLR